MHHIGLQEKAISDAEFDQLMTQLEQSPSADRASRIATATQFCFFTSLQVNTHHTLERSHITSFESQAWPRLSTLALGNQDVTCTQCVCVYDRQMQGVL